MNVVRCLHRLLKIATNQLLCDVIVTAICHCHLIHVTQHWLQLMILCWRNTKGQIILFYFCVIRVFFGHIVDDSGVILTLGDGNCLDFWCNSLILCQFEFVMLTCHQSCYVCKMCLFMASPGGPRQWYIINTMICIGHKMVPCGSPTQKHQPIYLSPTAVESLSLFRFWCLLVSK